MQWIAQGQGKTCAGLRVILQILQEWRRQVQSLAAENLRLSCLVKIKLSRVNRKTQLQRPVAQVGFGEAEHQVALAVADVGLDSKSLAETKKIIRAVTKSDERPRQTAYPPTQSDLILAFFLELEG